MPADCIEKAARTLKSGRPVLLYDCDGREEETDMIVAAEKVTPKLVATLRKDAGGLLCVAIKYETAETLALPSMVDILKVASSRFPILAEMTLDKSPYGDKPAFSITLNHRDAYTGITDRDRALTIQALVELVRNSLNGVSAEEVRAQMASTLRTPGHVHLLIADRLFIRGRQGHTELSLALAELCGVLPVTVICEMLDGETGKALSYAAAEGYASMHGLPLLKGEHVAEAYEQAASTGRISVQVAV